jgi:hypothetical protein
VRVLAIAALAACGPAERPRCVDMIAPGELVITEVLAAPIGADDGYEWFELYNASGRDLELAGLELVHSRPDGSQPARHAVSELAVAAGAYAVLGNAASGHLPPHVDYGYGEDLGALYDTGGGKLVLACSATTIDAITYDDVAPAHSRELAAGVLDAVANDDPARWCQCDGHLLDSGDFATPGQPNDCVPLAPGQCRDGDAARAIVAPVPGQLAISEVMANPKIEPSEEWFEVTNLGAAAFDLNDLAIDRAGDSRAPDAIRAADCKPIAPGGFALFARSADPAANGMLPAVDATFGFALVNSGGDVRVLAGTTVLDAVTWTTSTDGTSLQLLPVVCPAIAPYGDGANKGTPRAPNSCM